jgi:hypothetical protein
MMKWQTKPNQSQIFKPETATSREVLAIRIDLINCRTYAIKVDNYMEYILPYLKIFNYEVITINEKRDCIIVGVDDDYQGKGNKFSIKGNDKEFYGEAIIVGLPPNQCLDRFKKTTLTIEEVNQLISFS